MTIRDSHTYDNLTLLKDAGAVTADGVGTVGGVPRVLDLGDAKTEGRVVVDTSALKTTAGDETQRISLQGCAAIGFGSGVVELASLDLRSPGRSEALFSTRQGNTNYRYARLYIDVGGTSPSVNLTAFIAKN